MTNNGYSGATVLDLSIESTKVFSWNDFSYLSIPCPVALYQVKCTDPQTKTLIIDGDGNLTGDLSSRCFQFNIDTNRQSRTIEVPTTIDSYYEGVYQIEVEGYS